MENFKENLKVKLEPITNTENMDSFKESRNVELIIEYIKKEKEVNRMFDKADGIDVDAEDYKPDESVIVKKILNILEYRKLRTEQAWYSDMARGDFSRSTRQELYNLNNERRFKHNLALTSFLELNEFAKKYGLEPIYKGEMLTAKEIVDHNPGKLDARQEMTDSFLKLLLDLGDYSIRKCNEPDAKKELMKIQNNIAKIQRDYKVKKELEYDDGDILFDEDFEQYR